MAIRSATMSANSMSWVTTIAVSPTQGEHGLLAHAIDPGPEEGHLARIGSDEAGDDPQEHGLARSAAAHHRQRGATVELEADAPQHVVGLEGLPDVPQLDEGRRQHGRFTRTGTGRAWSGRSRR